MSTLNERKIAIPYHYIWMAQESNDPGRLFKAYVSSYVRNTHPGWRLMKVEKMNAVIEKD